MSRRRRPPLTARQIAAYGAGGRLYRLWRSDPARLPAGTDWLMSRLAAQDVYVLASLGSLKYWYWFDRGWDDAAAVAGP